MAYLGGNPKPLYYMLYERPSLYILQYSLHILHSLYDLAVCINVLTKQHPSVVLIIIQHGVTRKLMPHPHQKMVISGNEEQQTTTQTATLTATTAATPQMANLQGITTPSIDWSSTSIDESFEDFKETCELIFEGPLADLEEKRKVNYLKLWSGSEGRSIIKTWQLSQEEAAKLDTYWKKYKDYVKPKSNFRIARYKLRACKQEDCEPVDVFVKRIRTILAECKYSPEQQNEHLLDAMVFGIKSEKIQGTLLQKDESLTVDDAISIARTEEATQQQVQELRSKKVDVIQKHRKHKGNQHAATLTVTPQNRIDNSPQRICGNCGHEPHMKDETCPAKGKRCSSCQKIGHFQRVCRSTPQLNYRQVPKKDVNCVEADKDDEQFVIMSTISVNSIKTSYKVALVDLTFRTEEFSRNVSCKIDTGAEANVMPLNVAKALFPNIEKLLKPSPVRITAFGGTNIPQLGTFLFSVEFKDKQLEVEFFITDTAGSVILGLKSSTDLNLIIFNHEIKNQPSDSKLTQTILKDYADVFDGIGCFEGECKITVDPNVQPVVHAPRRVPIAVKDSLKEELDSLVNQGILSPVTYPTDWVNSCVCVTKSNGKIRLCLDPKDLNKAIKRPHYITPTLDDVFAEMSGAKYFSILDARSGYWNIKLDSKSADLTTFNTTFGRFRFNRMPMGIICAQDEFQRLIDATFGDIPNTVGIADDLVVFGSTEAEHDKALHNVLQRARERGPKFNEDKMILKCNEIPFFGHLIGSNGVRPDPAKVEAIQSMQPDNLQSMQTFLGMINYLHRFSPNIAALTAPLRDLCRQDVEFIMGPEHLKAIDGIKEEITNVKHLPFYNPKEKLILQVDASLNGLGAALIQEKGPVAFASKALTDTETRYSNIEREMLAILWGLEKFHHYVFGRHVIVETDHKPLESISKKNLYNAPPRLTRMLLRAQRYHTTIKYVPGKDIPLADALSRITPLDKYEVKDLQMTVHEVQSSYVLVATPARLEDIRTKTDEDTELCLLKETITKGWPETRSECPMTLHPYWNYRDELAVENGLLLKGIRIIIPRELQREVLDKIHCGHQGIEKCRLRACAAVFWKGMNKDIEDLVSKCNICQKYQPSQSKESFIPHEVPPSPWHTVASDLFTWRGNTHLIVADPYSRFPIVRRLHSLSSMAVIAQMRPIFEEYGIPAIVQSDNGPQYASSDFSKFAKQYGFEHITSSPHYPQSNGFIERMIRTVKLIFDKTKDTGSDPHLALLAYRSTPQDSNTASPGELMFNRPLRTTLVQKPQVYHPSAREQLLSRKDDMLNRPPTRHLPPLTAEQHVRVQDPITKKWNPGTVEEVLPQPRSYLVNTETGTLRRNRQHLRTTKETFPPHKENDVEIRPEATKEQPLQENSSVPVEDSTPPLRRSTRATQPPDRFSY